MSKYTPAPWNVWGETKLCVNAEKRSVACASQETMADWETAKANAQLIAAAPELLEALEQLVMINKIYSEDKEYDFAWAEMQFAKQAIAKAKGE